MMMLSACSEKLQFESDPLESNSPPSSLREISFSAEAQEFRPTVKVGLVVDNSRSMQDEQNALSLGFERLLQSFKNDRFNLEFFIFTTSQVGAKRVANESTEFHYVDPTSGEARITSDMAILNLEIPNTFQRVVQRLVAPQITAGGPIHLKIRSDMTAAEFDEAVSFIQQSIESLGTDGADNERGLCSLARMLLQAPGDYRVFQHGDVAALMIVSDANDQSSQTNCDAYTETRFGPANSHTPLMATPCRPGMCSPEATQWRYRAHFRSLTADLVRIEYLQASCVIDGQRRSPCPLPQAVQRGISLQSLRGPLPITEEFAWAPCPTILTDWIADHPTWEAPQENSCRYYTHRSSRFWDYTDSQHLTLNLCSPETSLIYSQNNISRSAESLHDYHLQTKSELRNASGELLYAPAECQAEGSLNPAVGGRYLTRFGINSPRRRVSVQSLLDPASSDLKEAIVAKASRLFGANGFVFSAIVEDPQLTRQAEERGWPLACQGEPESAGVEYLALASLLPDQSTSHSICLADYSPALEPFQKFIRYMISSVYSVRLFAHEQIESVIVKRKQKSFLMPKNKYALQRVGDEVRLEFARGAIARGDRIVLRIQKPAEK